MATHIFIPGTFARLKSGGPVMVIERVRDEHVDCRWFVLEHDRMRTFLAATLDPVDPTEVATLADDIHEL